MRKTAIAIAALGLAACNQPQRPPHSEVGRFQIQQVGKRTILLDTDQGKAWELIAVDGVSKGWSEIKSI